MQTYLVGGAVRDELLGIEVKDRDWVVVGATPDDMLARGFKQVGADFPVFLHPNTREEYALARTERKQGRGYHGFTVYSAPDVTLEDDLKRRDLTINAMARSESGELIDPFNGLADLRTKTLRHVSPAFAEDPLRIFRTARFAARFQPEGFAVCDSTLALMQRMVAEGEVAHLAPERVWQEIQRALGEREPGTFFDVLRACGALGHILPELDEPKSYARALASLRCISNTGSSTEQRFAALLAVLNEEQAVNRAQALKAPNSYRDLARLVCQLRRSLETLADLAPVPDRVLTMLDNADLWRRPERFRATLPVLACVLGEHQQPLLDQLQVAARAATGVNPGELVACGYKGKALGAAIQQQRLQRIEQALTQTRGKTP